MTIKTRHKLNVVLKSSFVTMFALVVSQFVLSSHVSAATLVPDSGCSLDSAVASFNAASNQAGCVASGTYGANDTLDIQAGTFSYLNNDYITVPVHIKGAGIGQTTVDLANNNFGFLFKNLTSNSANITVEDMTIINGSKDASNPWVGSQGYSATFQRLEFYSAVLPAAGNEAGSVIEVRSGNDIDGLTSKIQDVYIHDTSAKDAAIRIYAENDRSFINNQVSRNTLSNVSLSTTVGGALLTIGGASIPGTTEARIENNTISGTRFSAQAAVVAAAAMVYNAGENASAKVVAINNTIKATPNPDMSGSFSAVSGAPNGSTSNAQIVLQNNLIITDNATIQGAVAKSVLGLGGNELLTITSLGGNIAGSYFGQTSLNHPTDQEIPSIGNLVGPLQYNGGTTLTMALLPGSPAIDAGVVVAGMTVDQRGIARPQGTTFDVGAYEYEPHTPDPGTNNQGNDPSSNNSKSNTDLNANNRGKLANTGSGINILIASIAGISIVAVATSIAYLSKKSRLPKTKYSLNKYTR